MRKGISSALLLLLAVNLVGPYAFFAYRAVQIKSQMRALLATLPDEELDLIKLTPDAFKQARVGKHEIKVGGKMFDIARTVEKNGEVCVYGVYDEDEDNLLSFLDAVLNNLQRDSRPSPPSIILFTILNSIPEYYHFDFTRFPATIQLFGEQTEPFYAFSPIIDSPPPRI